ncbi:hypothetical protein OCJ37_14885 [Xanthomonas sp. AM6]|uniref:hypothetical protein n=1 Tax=Xanthomonas sp. AM6 TaxID=2982531 RepID=UPI0021D8C392|nr:hypothetical protein [Xanthomonas sp. AM6]UYB51271.1 hypothetical protein OCJ37_14885 [Xanthomonas sp. AM6]
MRRAGECRSDDHPHLHGANLGFSADLYGRCGAFLPLAAPEDVSLVEAMVRVQAREWIQRLPEAVERSLAEALLRTAGGDRALLGEGTVPARFGPPFHRERAGVRVRREAPRDSLDA